MSNPLLVDGRNFLDPKVDPGAGIAYEAIGRPSVARSLGGAADVQALILAGGEGTRLRPAHLHGPEAGAAAGRPTPHRLCDRLACRPRHQRRDHLLRPPGRGTPERARELEPDVRIRYAEEPDARGTAGAIRFAEDMLAERFFVLNGDILCDLDLTAQVEQHDRTGARATLALYPVPDPTGYGLIHRQDDGEITEFLEKPEPHQIDTDEINAGAYLLERSVLEQIPPDRAVSIEREVFPHLVGDGLYGIRLEGYWIDIGTPERYLEANWDILEGRVETLTRVDDPPRWWRPDARSQLPQSSGPRAWSAPTARSAPAL